MTSWAPVKPAVRHATNRHEDFAIDPWYSKDRSSPEPMKLTGLPEAR